MTTLSTTTTIRTDAMIRMRSAASRALATPPGAADASGGRPVTGNGSRSGRSPAARETRPPLLDAEEERALILAWKTRGDRQALDRLVRSYQALVIRIASQYRTGTVAQADLVSEGNVGLMHAIEKFDVDRGFRLSSYAVWWIRAMISEFALAGSSLVKGVTVERHRRILFNLRRIKARLGEIDGASLSPEATATIAAELGVEESDVTYVHGWATARQVSVNTGPGHDEDAGSDWQDTLVDPAEDPEAALINDDETRKRRDLIRAAISGLDEREQHVIARRHLAEQPELLVDIGRRFGVSRERVRQIEARALAKLRRRVAALAGPDDGAGDGAR